MLPCAFGIGYLTAIAWPLAAVDAPINHWWSVAIYAVFALALAEVHVHRYGWLAYLAMIAFVLVGGAGCVLAADSLAPQLTSWKPVAATFWQPVLTQAASGWLACSFGLAVLVFPSQSAAGAARPVTLARNASASLQPDFAVVAVPLTRPPAALAPPDMVERVIVKIRCSYCGALTDPGVSRCPACHGPQ